MNVESVTIKYAVAELAIENCKENAVQFMRKGYYILDKGSKNIFNKTVSLKDGFKI